MAIFPEERKVILTHEASQELVRGEVTSKNQSVAGIGRSTGNTRCEEKRMKQTQQLSDS